MIVKLLLRRGANINTADFTNSYPIARAIFLDHCNVLKILCMNNPMVNWGHSFSESDENVKTPDSVLNLLEEAAVFASVEAMEILTSSEINVVNYDPERVDWMFYQWRRDYSFRAQEENQERAHAALQKLLFSKGRAIVSNEMEEIGTQGLASEEEIDLYEDALEDLSHLNLGEARSEILIMA